jgi:hypothetical protein
MSDESTRSLDPRRDALHTEWLNHQRAYEHDEATMHEKLDRERASYDAELSRKHKQADGFEQIELERSQSLRSLRSELDHEVLAAHDITARTFANLGLGYVPGKSKVEDLYQTKSLPAVLAAERAGVSHSATHHDALLVGLKFAGMLGCLLLSTISMGAVIFHIQPKSILHSPLLIIALGLAFILVGGVYLVVAPPSKKLGSMMASKPDSPATKKCTVSLIGIVASVTVIMALIDAKAITAINATRAMINPESAPSFGVTFLIAAALSAMHVVGTCFFALSEGVKLEATERIEAEQHRHQESFRAKRANSLEVAQACEALNAVEALEARRASLEDEIRRVDQGLRESISDTFAGTPPPPELPEDKQKHLRLHEQEARVAAQKLTAYDALRSKLNRFTGTKPEGGAE